MKFCAVRLSLAVVLLPHLAGGVVDGLRGAAPRAAEQVKAVQDRLDEENEADKKVNDQLDCWCQAQLAEKEHTVEDMKSQLKSLSSDIEAQTAGNTRLDAELGQHEQELEEDARSLQEATAIRGRSAMKFASDEQSQVQSIDALNSVLTSLNRGQNGGSELALSQLRDVALQRARHGGGAARSKRDLILAQVQERLTRSKQSPEMVTGIVRQMKSTFESDLEDARKDEATTQVRHEDLAALKKKQMDALHERFTAKKQRAADGKLQVEQKKEQSESYQALLDANVNLLASARALCGKNSEGFQERQKTRRSELVVLARVQVDLASTQFLSIEDRARLDPSGAAMQLCNIALEVTNKQWHTKASEVCKLARDGKATDATDAAQDLADGLKEAHRSVVARKEECESSAMNERAAASDAAADRSVRAAAIDSDKSAIDGEIVDINSQIASSKKAAKELVDAHTAQKDLMHSISVASHNAIQVMRGIDVAGNIRDALLEATTHAQKMFDTAQAFGPNSDGNMQEVLRFLDATTMAAGRALIPLRLMRADQEEAAVTVNDERPIRRVGHVCDPAALGEEAEHLEDQAHRIGESAAALAWEMAR